MLHTAVQLAKKANTTENGMDVEEEEEEAAPAAAENVEAQVEGSEEPNSILFVQVHSNSGSMRTDAELCVSGAGSSEGGECNDVRDVVQTVQRILGGANGAR